MKSKSGPKSPGDARAERLRSALRENLKRRKAQARGRAADDSGRGSSTRAGDDGAPAPDGEPTR